MVVVRDRSGRQKRTHRRSRRFGEALLRRIPTSNLCNRLLHNCPGDAIYGFCEW